MSFTHRFPSMRLTVLAVLFAAVSSWYGDRAALGNDVALWTVTKVDGDAEYKQGDSAWNPLVAGRVLVPGSRVRTGSGGRVLLTRPGDSVAVSPNSRFRIPGPDEKGSVGQFFQSLGTLLFKIKTRPDDPFDMKTPFLAAVIKGTTFTVSVSSRHASLHVSTGAVQVTAIAGGSTALVRAGQTAVVDSSKGGGIDLTGVGGNSPIKKAGLPHEQGGRGNVIPYRLGAQTIDASLVTGGLIGNESESKEAGSRESDEALSATVQLGLGGSGSGTNGGGGGLTASASLESEGSGASLGAGAGTAAGGSGISVGGDVGAGVGGTSIGAGIGADVGGSGISVGGDVGASIGGTSIGTGIGADVGEGGLNLDLGGL